MNARSAFAIFIAVGIGACPIFGQSIGSGHPGLKVHALKSGSIVIYQDEPNTFGNGLMGGMKDRKIKVIVDQGYNFDQASMEIPEQLFPFDPDSAFSCDGGTWAPGFKQWDYSRRETIGYRLADGRLTIFSDVQKEAAIKYNLSAGDEFLGCIDNRVFFWKNFNPSHIYWHDLTLSKTYSFRLPKTVIDLHGVARGIRKDVKLLTFSKSHGWFRYSPYTHEAIEFKLSQGAPIAP
jgi:hypothetical protein